MDKEKLISLTAKDFEWSYTRGSGKGGQKRNKTSSAVHCKHEPSGAYGYSDETRSQHDNKRKAFRKCVETKKFQNWIKLESARKAGVLAEIEKVVEKELERVRVEVKQDGKWVEENNVRNGILER